MSLEKHIGKVWLGIGLVALAALIFGLFALNDYIQTDHTAIQSYVDKRVYGSGGADKVSPAPSVWAHRLAPPAAPPVRPGQVGNLTAEQTTPPVPAFDSHAPACIEDMDRESAGEPPGGAGPPNPGSVGSTPASPAIVGGWQSLPRAPAGVGIDLNHGGQERPPAKPQSVPEPSGGLLLVPGILMVLLRFRMGR